jgi:manganese/iron transport system substrate-binding protein
LKRYRKLWSAMKYKIHFNWLGIIVAALVLTACASSGAQNTPTSASKEGASLRVVATTTIIGNVVQNITGDHAQVITLLPTGSDPHSFQPTPRDVATVADAHLIFANGLGLEEFLQPLLKNAGSQAKIVYVNEGVPLLSASDVAAHHENPGSTPASGAVDADPHTWFDPNNVMIWTENIERTLSDLDANNAQTYAQNADQYRQQLQELDAWIRQQVAQVPENNRKLVSDHAIFTYFAQRYGFEQVGAVIPSYSTLSEPSAQEIAKLEDSIRQLGVQAIFVSESVNPNLSKRIAQDTGIQLVFVYTGSLTPSSGPASTYLDFMHFDVSAIVQALK